MKTNVVFGTALAMGACLIAGCGAGNGGQITPVPGAAGEHESGTELVGDLCPMKVIGTTVAAADIEGGASLVFMTRFGDVGELRRRVQRMAELNNTEGDGVMMGGGGRMMPAAVASVENTERGGRIALIVKDPEHVAALREHVRKHAARMATGRCPTTAKSATATSASP